MASESAKDMAWGQVYDIVRLSRYYASMGSNRSKLQMFNQAVSLVASMGAITAVLEYLPVLGIVSGTVVGISSVINVTWNNPSRIATILAASAKCRAIEIEVLRAWRDLGSMEEAEASNQWAEFAERIEEATMPIEMVGIGYSKRQSRKAEAAARNEMQWLTPASSA